MAGEEYEKAGAAVIVLFWLSSFFTVFLLGFQSRSVNQARIVSAAGASFFIALMQCTATRFIISNDWLTAVLVTGTAGPCGVCAAIWVHRRLMRH